MLLMLQAYAGVPSYLRQLEQVSGRITDEDVAKRYLTYVDPVIKKLLNILHHAMWDAYTNITKRNMDMLVRLITFPFLFHLVCQTVVSLRSCYRGRSHLRDLVLHFRKIVTCKA